MLTRFHFCTANLGHNGQCHMHPNLRILETLICLISSNAQLLHGRRQLTWGHQDNVHEWWTGVLRKTRAGEFADWQIRERVNFTQVRPFVGGKNLLLVWIWLMMMMAITSYLDGYGGVDAILPRIDCTRSWARLPDGPSLPLYRRLGLGYDTSQTYL
jgi:hypothetical protein